MNEHAIYEAVGSKRQRYDKLTRSLSHVLTHADLQTVYVWAA
jgi:hypothetical protein